MVKDVCNNKKNSQHLVFFLYQFQIGKKNSRGWDIALTVKAYSIESYARRFDKVLCLYGDQPLNQSYCVPTPIMQSSLNQGWLVLLGTVHNKWNKLLISVYPSQAWWCECLQCFSGLVFYIYTDLKQSLRVCFFIHKKMFLWRCLHL